MLHKQTPRLISVSIALSDSLTLFIAVAGLLVSLASTFFIPFGRWVARRWQKIRYVEREMRLQAEADLLESQKAQAILEVQLRHCEGELHGTEFDGGAGEQP